MLTFKTLSLKQRFFLIFGLFQNIDFQTVSGHAVCYGRKFDKEKW